MIPFDFQPRTRIVFGAGKVDTLGELAAELGVRRALLVSDPGVVEAGHTDRGVAALQRCDIQTHCFTDVHENPTTADVEAAYNKITQLIKKGSDWYKEAPEACEKIKKRVNKAYDVLKEEESRHKYRVEVYGNVNYAAVSDLLAQKAKAASMRTDKSEYDDAMSALREVSKSSKQAPKRGKFKI